MTLTIVNMVLIIEKEGGCGITLINGNPDHSVITIAVKWSITNMLKLHNGCHPVVRKIWGDNYVKHKQEYLYKI